MTTDVQVRPVADNPMAIIARAVASGQATPDALAKLMDLQERHERNEAAKAFAVALAEFQKRCPSIFKGRTTTDGKKYASMDDVMFAIAPHLADVGLCVSFDVEHVPDSKNLHVVTILRHGIHEHRTRFSCPVPDMRVNETQKMGAALSYARRYALCAALNIIGTDKDTDGKGLGETPQTITEQQAITLGEMVEASGADLAKFLKWAKCDSLTAMPAAFYQTAFDSLKAKMGGKR